MKTQDQIELTPSVIARQNLTARTAVASLTTTTLPVLAQNENTGDRDATTIHPFRVNIPEAELTELRRRINATRWSEPETVTDASQGVQLATIQALARYWATEYDARSKRNSMPCLSSSPRSMDWTFISSTFGLNMRMRCHCSSRTDGPVRSFIS